MLLCRLFIHFSDQIINLSLYQMCIRDRYKMAGFDMFDEMTANIQEDTIRLLYQIGRAHV